MIGDADGRATGKTRRGCRRSALTPCPPPRADRRPDHPPAAGRARLADRGRRRGGDRADQRGRRRRPGQASASAGAAEEAAKKAQPTKPPNRARSATRPRRPTGSPTAARCRSSSTTSSARRREGAPYPELYVGRTDFEKQMDWLEERGYEAVTLEQVQEAWYHDGTLPPKPIVISFDDGYRPQFTFALPTLRKHGWAGVLNLKAEGSELYESNVKAMIAAGWELAAHTIHHLDLTELGPEELKEEVAGSRKILQEEFNVPVDNFCYPAGQFDETVIEAVEAAGYTGATTEISGFAEKGKPYELAPPGDPARIARRRPRGGSEERRRRNRRRRRLSGRDAVDAVGGEALLGLRHRVLPVVEDRGAEDGVGAAGRRSRRRGGPARRRRRRRSPGPAPRRRPRGSARGRSRRWCRRGPCW